MTGNKLSQIYPNPDVDMMIGAALATVGESSRRSYSRTYALWVEWCEAHHRHPTADLSALHVRTFLESGHTAIGTRNNYLSHLRRLARTLALDPQDQRAQANWNSLGLLRAPSDGARRVKEKDKFLHPDEVNTLIFAWLTETNIGARNRAIVSILLTTGVRRSECATLRWPDLDWDARTIRVRHGKGDKPRVCQIVDSFCMTALTIWYERSHPRATNHRQWMFCKITSSGDLSHDNPVSGTTIYGVVRATSTMTGIPFHPHMARHTHTTELLRNDASLADVQAQLGHANPATTLHYSHARSAEKRNFQTRWRQTDQEMDDGD